MERYRISVVVCGVFLLSSFHSCVHKFLVIHYQLVVYPLIFPPQLQTVTVCEPIIIMNSTMLSYTLPLTSRSAYLLIGDVKCVYRFSPSP